MRERSIRTVVYLSAEEADKLENICEIAGQRKSTIIRQWILGCKIKPRPPDSYRELARELSAIGTNINQIARLANAKGEITAKQMAELTTQMGKIWQLVQKKI